MFFNNNLERPDVFLDEEIMFKVPPNSELNFAYLRTTGPRKVQRLKKPLARCTGPINLAIGLVKNVIYYHDGLLDFEVDFITGWY